MKRLLLFVAFVLIAGAASAADADRDILIASDGTLFSIASEPSEDGLTSSLALTVQADGKTSRSLLPESVGTGVNSHPALAYDAESKTLFVFWQRIARNATVSEFLIAPYQKNEWHSAVSIDSRQALRYNLNVAITRRVRQLQRDGSIAVVPALILHAVWWEDGQYGEGARYAVMSLSGNAIVEPDVHDMIEFLTDRNSEDVNEKMNHDFLRHVAILDGPTPDAVDVLAADSRTNTFHRTTLRPIADGRLHIPGGVRGPQQPFGGPRALSGDWSGRVSTFASSDGGLLLFANTKADKVTYLTFDGKWSAAKEIALGDKLTADAALAALAKMVSAR